MSLRWMGSAGPAWGVFFGASLPVAVSTTRSPGQPPYHQRVQQSLGDLTQLPQGGVALQGQGQPLCSLVTDLVVPEVQLPQGGVDGQALTEGGKGIFPCA